MPFQGSKKWRWKRQKKPVDKRKYTVAYPDVVLIISIGIKSAFIVVFIYLTAPLSAHTVVKSFQNLAKDNKPSPKNKS